MASPNFFRGTGSILWHYCGTFFINPSFNICQYIPSKDVPDWFLGQAIPWLAKAMVMLRLTGLLSFCPLRHGTRAYMNWASGSGALQDTWRKNSWPLTDEAKSWCERTMKTKSAATLTCLVFKRNSRFTAWAKKTQNITDFMLSLC